MYNNKLYNRFTKKRGKKFQNIYKLFNPTKRDVLTYNAMKCFRKVKMTKFRLFGVICILNVELVI